MLQFIRVVSLGALLNLSFINIATADTENAVGLKTYTSNCTTCHSKSMSQTMQAPAMQTPAAWTTYLVAAIKDASKNNTTDCSSLTKSSSDTSGLNITNDQVQTLTPQQKACYLLPIAKTGKTTGSKVMPPKGNCTACTDAELQDAISYMLSAPKALPGSAGSKTSN